MAAPTIDKLVKSFEKPHIPPINGEPPYTTLQGTHELLNSNAASVATNLGCGNLGHLCLVTPPTIYATFSTTRVVPPLNTGLTPVTPAGATGPKAVSIQYAHDAATPAFNTFDNVKRALRLL